jgi:predicted naringenin-chalcone synthase
VGCRADRSTANNKDSVPTLTNNFSSIIPNTESMMTWRIGDAGFRRTLSAEVPEIIKQHLPPVLDEFFLRNGLTRSDIGG